MKAITKDLECSICGQWMEYKYLKDHNCPGNRNTVEDIKRFFKYKP